MESLYFLYDNIKSSDMGLYNVRIDHSGFVETPYWGEGEIEEEYSMKKITPYDYGIRREPISFTLQFVLADENLNPVEWGSQKRFEIARWLIGDGSYKSFQTSDDLGKYYFVRCISSGNLNLTSGKGYVELTFRSNSPYAWSSTYISEHDLSTNTTSTIIQLENRSNVVKYYKPKIEIELIGTEKNVTLKNLSNNGKETKITNALELDIFSIDNENRWIESKWQTVGDNPMAKFNRVWLELIYGVNEIQIFGRCKLKIKSCFPIAQ